MAPGRLPRQSFVVHLAGTTRASCHFRWDFDSANANRDDAVDDVDDTDAPCAPETRSIQSSSETAASTQRDGEDLAADYVEDTADTVACEEARGGIAVAADTERDVAVAEADVGNIRRVRFDQYRIRAVVVVDVVDYDDNNTVADDDNGGHPGPVRGGCAPV